jgi:hypothetical protein
MSKSEISSIYKQLNEPQQRSLRAWLTNTAVIASLFALALVAMAWGGSISRQQQAPSPQAERSSELSAAGPAHRVHTHSPHDLMLRLPPDHLPIERVETPY